MFKMVQTADYHTVCVFDLGNANVIDLGYNDGSFQKDIGNIFKSYSYVAVEADPKFKPIGNIILLNRLAAARSGVHRSFQIEPHGKGSSTAVFQSKQSVDTVTVTTITIQDIYSVAPFSTVDVLKIDIEGSEFEVLDQDTIGFLATNTRQICIEFHDWLYPEFSKTRSDIIRHFAKAGFYCTKMSITNHGAYLLINKNMSNYKSVWLLQVQVNRFFFAFVRLLRRIRVFSHKCVID